VQKSKPQRSQYNLSQSTVQKVISGDLTALATLANLPTDSSSGPYSDSSSQPPSTASSTSSTPRIDAIGVGLRNEQLSGVSQLQSDSSQGSPWSSAYDRPSSAQTTISSRSIVETPGKSCCCSNDSEEPVIPSDPLTSFPTNTQDLRQPDNRLLNQQQMQTPFNNYNTQEQYQIHQENHLPELNTDFGTYELSVGCAGMHSMSMAPSLAEHKDCHCGDTCACFACATHPNNRTTLDYVRYHNDLVMRTQYDQVVQYDGQVRQPYVMAFQQYNPSQHPTTNIHPTYGQSIRPTFNIQQPFAYQNIDWSRTTLQGMPPIHSPTTDVESLHFETVSQSMARPNIAGFDPNLHVLNGQYQSALQQAHPDKPISVTTESVPVTPRVLADIVNAGLEVADSPEDSSTLSPSSFLLQQFTLPDCSNVTGTCLCGEGCDCVGCITHSGHERVQNTKDIGDSSNNI
jgi:hypothetical protein